MLTTGLTALALMRFGIGRGGGLMWLFALVVVGALVWALTRPNGKDPAKKLEAIAGVHLRRARQKDETVR